MGKCWNHILPSKEKPCSIPTTEKELRYRAQQFLGTAICPSSVAEKVARVLKKFNDEIVMDRCKLHPSCLVHDRCFILVDNGLYEGIFSGFFS
jgi:hypothetical protein